MSFPGEWVAGGVVLLVLFLILAGMVTRNERRMAELLQRALRRTRRAQRQVTFVKQAAASGALQGPQGIPGIQGPPGLNTLHYADLWVDMNGNDITGNGSFGAPFATIAKANAIAQLGSPATNPSLPFGWPGVALPDHPTIV